MAITYQVLDNVAVISWNMTSTPMNVLNEESIPAFERALQQAFDEPTVRGIVITSAKPEFVAGADLKMILRNQNQDPQEMLQVSMELNRIFRRMETCGKPIVAALNGTALGGGYEIALACHRRIALDASASKIGLPEVKLGLLPGGGGTQRLPRMIGIQAALPLLLEGKTVSPKEALGLGMVEELVTTPEELMQRALAWIGANPSPLKPWDERDRKTGQIRPRDRYKIPGGDVQSVVGMQAFTVGTAMTMDKTKGNYPAAQAIMSCVYEGLQVNFDRAIPIEAQYFVQVATSKEAGNLIRTMFLGLNEANKGASRPQGFPKTEFKKIGILGAGMMGAGIAYVSAMAGLKVVLKDVTLEAAEKGKAYTLGLLQKAVERNKMSQEQADRVASLIQTTDRADELAQSQLIIEAVFENRELKAQVTQEAEPMLAQGGVFGSNTSTLPITGLAQASSYPENFIGIHFFSPVDKMMLVELIVGEKTSDYALAVAIDYVRKIRKTPIVVNDSRGFYTSRCFSSFSAEGMELLKDGVDPVLIENAAKLAGMPVGPLAVTDEVSIELMYKIASEAVRDGALSTEDTSYQVGRQFTNMGRLGKKSKAGFYEYPAEGTKYLWPGLSEVFPLAAVQPSLEEVKARLLYRQVIEARRCFEEGVIRTRLDADLGSILAWGFPAYTGGALSFIDYIGLKTFVAECERMASAYGSRFQPTEGLVEALSS